MYKEYVLVLFLDSKDGSLRSFSPRVCVTSVLMSLELLGSFQPLRYLPRKCAVFILFL